MYLAPAVRGRLGDSRFGESEVRAAYDWLNGAVSTVSSNYQGNFNWYRDNARGLSSVDRSKFSRALEQENASLQYLQTALWTFKQRAQQEGYLSSMSGLGAIPLLVAIPVGVVLVVLLAWVGSKVIDSVNNANKSAAEMDNLKYARQLAEKGAISPQDYASILDKYFGRNPSGDSNFPWGWAFGGLGVLGLAFWLRR